MPRVFHLPAYLLRDSLLRWCGRPLSPVARWLVVICLSTASLLVLGTFSLGRESLEKRIREFGLNTVVLKSPLVFARDPLPPEHNLNDYGQILRLRLAYTPAQLDLGGTATVAFAHENTLQELAAWNLHNTVELPILLTSTLPPDIHVIAAIGPWHVRAVTVIAPRELDSIGIQNLLIASTSNFPIQAQNVGQAVSILKVDTRGYDTASVVRALRESVQANPSTQSEKLSVQSALPLLADLNALQESWTRHAAIIGLILVVTIAAVFGASAMLEYEITAYTTALLRSFGASSFALWIQRCLESIVLVNTGWLMAMAVAHLVSHFSLPQLTGYLADSSTLMPLVAALNIGAILSGVPLLWALRRQIGTILQ